MSSAPPDPGNWSGAVFGSGYSAGPVAGFPKSFDDRYPAGAIDSRARNALILGVLAIVPLSVLTGIPAILLGYQSLRRIQASQGTLRGRGAAVGGIAMGCVSVLVLIALVVAARS